MSDEELEGFAMANEDADSDEQVELFIYSCFVLSQRSEPMKKYLETAKQQAEGWIAVTSSRDPHRSRRMDILRTIVEAGSDRVVNPRLVNFKVVSADLSTDCFDQDPNLVSPQDRSRPSDTLEYAWKYIRLAV
jgi:hypothetical protein